jgi:hypothetical protein
VIGPAVIMSLAARNESLSAAVFSIVRRRSPSVTMPSSLPPSSITLTAPSVCFDIALTTSSQPASRSDVRTRASVSHAKCQHLPSRLQDVRAKIGLRQSTVFHQPWLWHLRSCQPSSTRSAPD